MCHVTLFAAGLDAASKVTTSSTSSSQAVTRKDILNQVDLDEAVQMAKKLYEVMAMLGEDDSSRLLTTVYEKCLDLKAEKRKLNSRQTVVHDYFTQTTDPTLMKL